MSRDIIGMIEGVGGSQGGGGSWKVDQFGNLNNPSHFNKDKLHTQSSAFLILSGFETSKILKNWYFTNYKLKF